MEMTQIGPKSADLAAARVEGCNNLIASELMTKRVISTSADASVQSVAQLLLENNIGAAPVLDAKRAAVGIVSDGDLLGRRADDHRREWWLELMANGSLSPDAARAGAEARVCDVMSAPLITIGPATPAAEIVRTLQAHRIKRLPVVHSGELVGIVSRADLLGVIQELRGVSHAPGGLLKFLGSLAGGEDSLLGRRPHPAAPGQVTALAPSRALSAEQFRDSVRAYKHEAFAQAAQARREADLARRRQVEAVLETHVSAAAWRKLIDHADVAARHGEKEFLLLRFPCDLCSDGGRMIDVMEPGWEQTLRGEAAEIYARWRVELRPKGFGLSAKIVSYDDGVLGDIGLFLAWGE
jgi:CBS domain-containing protein